VIVEGEERSRSANNETVSDFIGNYFNRASSTPTAPLSAKWEEHMYLSLILALIFLALEAIAVSKNLLKQFLPGELPENQLSKPNFAAKTLQYSYIRLICNQ
jgi:hypothetical protein